MSGASRRSTRPTARRSLNRSAFVENRKFVEDIRGWSAITDKLYIWDYTTNFRHYIAPFPNVLALASNVNFFRDHRVVGLFEQGAYQGRHGEFAELKAWLLARRVFTKPKTSSFRRAVNITRIPSRVGPVGPIPLLRPRLPCGKPSPRTA